MESQSLLLSHPTIYTISLILHITINILITTPKSFSFYLSTSTMLIGTSVKLISLFLLSLVSSRAYNNVRARFVDRINRYVMDD